MKTVKINEGTKSEISLELEDDESIIFVKPDSNRYGSVYKPRLFDEHS